MEMEIDEKEMVKQLRKRIIKSGNYTKIELIVGDEMMPYTHVQVHGDGEILSKTFIALESLLEQLKKQYPLQYLYGKLSYSVKEGGTVNLNDKEGDSN